MLFHTDPALCLTFFPSPWYSITNPKKYSKKEWYTMLHTDFDPDRTAVISPIDVIEPVDHMPQSMVGVFSHRIVDAFVARTGSEPITVFKSCMGHLPIYRCVLPDGFTFALVSMPIGGPFAADMLEETHAMGVRQFVTFGSCGALDHQVTAGHLLVPTAAVRDEGTSYHYLPPAEEIALQPDGVAAVCDALDTLGVPYTRTKTWTTDGIFRETRGKVNKRLQQGCAVVEMECASMAAVAEFRGFSFAQFLWAADSLSGEAWDSRILGHLDLDSGALYMEIAIQALRNLQNKQEADI